MESSALPASGHRCPSPLESRTWIAVCSCAASPTVHARAEATALFARNIAAKKTIEYRIRPGLISVTYQRVKSACAARIIHLQVAHPNQDLAMPFDSDQLA